LTLLPQLNLNVCPLMGVSALVCRVITGAQVRSDIRCALACRAHKYQVDKPKNIGLRRGRA